VGRCHKIAGNDRRERGGDAQWELATMSIDRSLNIGSSLARHRNVLTRAERIKRLQDQETWRDDRSAFGLPKVANRNLHVGKKVKKKEEADEKAAEPDTKAKAKGK